MLGSGLGVPAGGRSAPWQPPRTLTFGALSPLGVCGGAGWGGGGESGRTVLGLTLPCASLAPPPALRAGRPQGSHAPGTHAGDLGGGDGGRGELCQDGGGGGSAPSERAPAPGFQRGPPSSPLPWTAGRAPPAPQTHSAGRPLGAGAPGRWRRGRTAPAGTRRGTSRHGGEPWPRSSLRTLSGQLRTPSSRHLWSGCPILEEPGAPPFAGEDPGARQG